MPLFSVLPSAGAQSSLPSEVVFRRTLRAVTSRLALFLGLPVLIWWGIVIFLIRAAGQTEEASRVSEELRAIQSSVVELDVAQRRFGGSAGARDAHAIVAARDRLSAHLDAAGKRSAGLRGADLAALRTEVGAWVDDLAQGAAGSPADQLRSLKLMEAARARLATMLESANRSLSEHAQLRRWLRQALSATLVLFFAVGLPWAAIWLRRLLRQVSEAYGASLAEAERRASELQVTLRSIGDAVLATNAMGVVIFLNPIAERLTGWTNAEAEGRPLSEVFVIFNEETGVPAEDPVVRVMREKVVVGLANHTVLRARDGTETPIEDSAAPILNEAGEMHGVILVFHDITEKRVAGAALEKNEARYRFLHSLSDAIRPLAEPGEIMAAVARLLGTQLRASRCAYADVEADGDRFTIQHDYTDGCASTVGEYQLGLFGPRAVAELRAGQTLVIRDVGGELPPGEGAEMFQAIDIGALVCCPLVKETRLRAMMAVHQNQPRQWAADEVSLIEEVVGRSWAYIESKRAQSALRSSEILKTAIIDTALDGFILMNHEGRIMDWNSAAERTFGLSRTEAVGANLGEKIVPARLREAHRAGLARYVASGDVRSLGKRYELPALRADGTEFPCEISINHIPGTEPPLFAGHTRDITDRQQAASTLAASEARWRQLADAMPQIVWMARPDGYLDYYNRRWYEFTGHEAGGGGDESWLPILHPDDRQPCLDVWYESVRSGANYEMRYRFHDRATGEYRWFLGRALPVRDEGGEITRWFGTCTEIDALVRAEEAAKRSREEAEQARVEAEAASRAKDSFLAALSHELRTPLTPVLMTAAALREDERLPQDAREQLEMMERNIALEARLIDDLLDLTRIAKGKLPLRPQACDAHSLIGLAVEIVRDEAQAKGIALALELTAQRSGLLADPARFQQVIWNLLRNAVKFTPRGGRITIRTRDEAGADALARLHIEVSDSGIGITREALEKIFLPFEQAGLTNDHRFGGMGLGLAIARAIVDLHGGWIRAESEGLDHGATFVVELPGATEPPSGISHEPYPFSAQPSLPGILSPQPAEGWPLLRLLLVEDHEPTLHVLSRLLARAGHEVVTAGTVAEALAAASAATFDLVISDLGLPDGTGNELMEQLRARHGLRGIALSGYGMEEDLVRSRDAGFAVHLVKPVDLNQLQRALREMVVEEAG